MALVYITSFPSVTSSVRRRGSGRRARGQRAVRHKLGVISNVSTISPPPPPQASFPFRRRELLKALMLMRACVGPRPFVRLPFFTRTSTERGEKLRDEESEIPSYSYGLARAASVGFRLGPACLPNDQRQRPHQIVVILLRTTSSVVALLANERTGQPGKHRHARPETIPQPHKVILCSPLPLYCAMQAMAIDGARTPCRLSTTCFLRGWHEREGETDKSSRFPIDLECGNH